MKNRILKTTGLLMIIIILTSAFSMFSIEGAEASDDPSTMVVYVADGGSGDGSTAASPLGNINDAIAAINAEAVDNSAIKAGKIVLAGNYTTSASFTEKAHNIPITYTSTDKAKNKLILGNNFSIKGDVIMTGLEIYVNRDSETMVLAYGYKLVMGKEDVADDIIVSGSSKWRLTLVGGGNNSSVEQVNVVINSGTYTYFRIGSGASGGTVSGDVNWVVNNATVKDTVSIGGVSKSNSIGGKTKVIINGGTYEGNIYIGCCAADNTSTFDDSVTLKLNNGTFQKKISSYTSGGTVTFKKGCVIDISEYKGTSDLSGIILESNLYTVNLTVPETEALVTTSVTSADTTKTAQSTKKSGTDTAGNETTAPEDADSTTNSGYIIYIVIGTIGVVVCGVVVFLVIKKRKPE